MKFRKEHLILMSAIFVLQSVHGNNDLLTVNNNNGSAVVYVGNTYPANGRMQLELLKREGLQSNQYVLEIGCGALVAGIPTMLFLEKGHFVGIDPNKWLIDASISIPENAAIVRQQEPTFLFNDTFDASELNIKFDYILAHSIMSHAAEWQLPLFLENCAKVLKTGGKVIFSIRLTEPNAYGSPGAPSESHSQQWEYPGNSFFSYETVVREASKWFSNVQLVPEYTALIVSSDVSAFHDWFVLVK